MNFKKAQFVAAAKAVSAAIATASVLGLSGCASIDQSVGGVVCLSGDTGEVVVKKDNANYRVKFPRLYDREYAEIHGRVSVEGGYVEFDTFRVRPSPYAIVTPHSLNGVQYPSVIRRSSGEAVSPSAAQLASGAWTAFDAANKAVSEELANRGSWPGCFARQNSTQPSPK